MNAGTYVQIPTMFGPARIYQVEDDAGRPGERDERPHVARLSLAGGEDDSKAGEEQDESVAGVAEHHAEHEHVGDGDEERRLQVVVGGCAVARDQHLEGAQEP